MGLLNKVLTMDNVGSTFSPDITRLMSSLNSGSTGLDFPSKLFSQIKKELQITKGAILLPEDDSLFVPWAETGFDRTTSRRIRLPQTLINSMLNWNDYDILELRESDIGVMSEFFSFREFSVTDSILLAPILAEKKLIAIIFISEGEILNQSRDFKLRLFQDLSNETGPLLISKRDNIVNKLEDVSQKDLVKEDIVSNFIDKNAEKNFLIIKVDVQKVIEHLLQNDSSAISFRIKQDILRLIKTLIADKGEVVNNNSNSLIILLNGNRVEEAELLIHQIGLSINYFYKINSQNFKLDHLIKIYPEDGKNVEQLLSSINTK